MKKGRFIVFEGLDGSGKSTQILAVAKELRRRGEKVWLTAEPTASPTGSYIRTILAESLEKDMYLQGALFLADRIEHNTDPEDGILKHLKDGETVICDRYYYSSFAYQGTGSDLNWLMQMNLSCSQIAKPDLCIFLDVDPLTCKNRIDRDREKAELYEHDIMLMEKIRNKFFHVFDCLKDKENIVVVDANMEMNEVTKEILKNV